MKLALVLLLSLAGCATMGPNQVTVTYNSQPPGALIYDAAAGVAWGRTPQSRVYTLDTPEGIATVSAAWPSGATVTEQIRISRSMPYSSYTFSRPISAPGLSLDLPQAVPTVICTKIGASTICH